MAIQHCDNFSIYGTNPAFLLNGVYADAPGVALVTDPDGISGGHVLQATASFAEGGVRYVLSALESTVGVCGRLWMPSLPSSSDNTPAIIMKDVGNNPIVGLGCDTTGRLSLFDQRPGRFGGAAFATTTGPVVTANAWWHIELKTAYAGSVCTYELRVEGQTVLSGSHAITSAAIPAQVVLGVVDFIGQNFLWKDFVVWDGTGANNNNFLGSVLVQGLTLTSDVALNWTPVGGATGFAVLSNVPPLDGTQYLDAPNPPPAAYKAKLSALVGNVTSVKAVMSMVRAGKSDGGDASLQSGLISSPTATPATVLGANRPITVAQTYWRDVFEVDPKTGVAWLPGAFNGGANSTQIQMNRTT